jgi:hypothetical protein
MEDLAMSENIVVVKIKEFGKPIFKSKGRKTKVQQEVDDFWRFKQ